MLNSPIASPVTNASRVPGLVQEITFSLKPSISPEDLADWTQDLEIRLDRVQQHPEQGLGFIEEQVRQCTLELQRKVVERAMQAKADAVDECCCVLSDTPDREETARAQNNPFLLRASATVPNPRLVSKM